MEVLFLLVPLSVIFIGGIGVLLHWAIRSGQYDDLEKPGHDVVLDDDEGAGDGPDGPDQR
jgi:cbb3-type cytochrome oxidase maturation protein